MPPNLRFFLITCAAVASATYLPSRSGLALLGRQDTCPEAYDKCGSSLPSSFCCPSGTFCLELAGKTSTVCCNTKDGCNVIAPIVCDVALQKDPRSNVKTTALDSQLPKCGTDCCPFGYSCNSDSECVKNADQSRTPPSPSSSSTSAAPSSTTTLTPSGTVPPKSSSSATPTISSSSSSSSQPPTTSSTTSAAANATARPVSSENPAPSDQGDGSSGGGDDTAAKISIIGGVVGGIIALIAVSLMLCFCIRRRRRRASEAADESRRASAAAVYPHAISHPIVSGNSTMRSDFSRSSRERRASLRDPFRDRPASAASGASGRFPVRPTANPDGRTENINIFADPVVVVGGAGRDRARDRTSQNTTFTRMMREADLDADKPYVPRVAYLTTNHRR